MSKINTKDITSNSAGTINTSGKRNSGVETTQQVNPKEQLKAIKTQKKELQAQIKALEKQEKKLQIKPKKSKIK